jgi:hypothetical protein
LQALEFEVFEKIPGPGAEVLDMSAGVMGFRASSLLQRSIM